MDLSSVVSLRSCLVVGDGEGRDKSSKSSLIGNKKCGGKFQAPYKTLHEDQQQQQHLHQREEANYLAPLVSTATFKLARSSPLIGRAAPSAKASRTPSSAVRYLMVGDKKNSSVDEILPRRQRRKTEEDLSILTASVATSLSVAKRAADTMQQQQQPQVFADRRSRAQRRSLIWLNQSRSIPLLPTLSLQMLLLVSLLFAIMSALCWWPPVAVSAIKLQPEGRDKFYWTGEDFVVTCQNNNNIKNVKIRWIGPDGHDIPENRSQRVHAESTGPHGHRLVVQNASSPADVGQYKCTLGSTDDRNPREHLEFELKLYRTTSFRDTPRHLVQVASNNQQGTLTCKVEFDQNVQSATVSWSRDQQPIETYNDTTYTVLDYDPTLQISQLQIAPLTRHQAGTYTCRAVAVTSQLSKISTHDIKLEINYAPVFEQDSQVVWVERSSQQLNGYGRSIASGGNIYSASSNKPNQPPSPVPGAGSSNSRPRHPHMKQNHRRLGVDSADYNADQAQQQQTQLQQQVQINSNGTQVVRVELHCSCQANPPASILWTTTRSNFVLVKGAPEHIVEEPTSVVEGHNTSSTLIINYNLSADWQHRRESYICSATNKIGRASKSFEVEQGDPPPAFNVGPTRQYNPQNYLFKFTLLGPNFDPDTSSTVQAPSEQRDIVPPVDSFRIRAETPQAARTVAELKSTGNYWPNSNARRTLADLSSVQFTLNQQQHHLSNNNNKHTDTAAAAKNITVNLSRLPSGQQRLYLEAHNAVGWSPNATYLGDYYIVSGALSSLPNAQTIAIYFLALIIMKIAFIINPMR